MPVHRSPVVSHLFASHDSPTLARRIVRAHRGPRPFGRLMSRNGARLLAPQAFSKGFLRKISVKQASGREEVWTARERRGIHG